MSKFQQRHYEAIASVMREAKPEESEPDPRGSTHMACCYQHDYVIARLTRMFEADNPNFNSERFLAACEGVDTRKKRTARA